jgi:hypothetical protein
MPVIASTVVDLARVQFATTSTLMYHFLFVPLTLGLGPLVAKVGGSYLPLLVDPTALEPPTVRGISVNRTPRLAGDERRDRLDVAKMQESPAK